MNISPIRFHLATSRGRTRGYVRLGWGRLSWSIRIF